MYRNHGFWENFYICLGINFYNCFITLSWFSLPPLRPTHSHFYWFNETTNELRRENLEPKLLLFWNLHSQFAQAPLNNFFRQFVIPFSLLYILNSFTIHSLSKAVQDPGPERKGKFSFGYSEGSKKSISWHSCSHS